MYISVHISVRMCILVWIYVCIAFPVVVGTWSMVETLQWLFEYYLSRLVLGEKKGVRKNCDCTQSEKVTDRSLS